MTAARTFAAGLAVLAIGVVPACTSSETDQPQSADQPGQSGPVAGNGKQGPMFAECGGISDQTIAEQTRVTGLVRTAVTSVGCQWLVNGGIVGPHFSFTWFRGSPIGRERKTVELSRSSVEDISIEGYDGWVGIGTSEELGDHLCEIAIQFDDDFIEWSISYTEQPFPPPCDVAEELTRQTIVKAK
jgi:hypothetical protein